MAAEKKDTKRKRDGESEGNTGEPLLPKRSRLEGLEAKQANYRPAL